MSANCAACHACFTHGTYRVCPNCKNTARELKGRRRYVDVFVGKISGMLDASFCDATLETSDGGKVDAHRCVLATWSPVFAKMFSGGFKEQENGHVQMKDIDTVTLNELLTFLYTGELQRIDIATQKELRILMAADKYQVAELKEYMDSQIVELMKLGKLDYEILRTEDTRLRLVAVDLLEKALKAALVQ